jgi:hypothetical protein
MLSVIGEVAPSTIIVQIKDGIGIERLGDQDLRSSRGGGSSKRTHRYER